MGSQSTGTPDDGDSLLFLKHLAGKVEELSASLSEKEQEVMAERRTMSPKYNGQSLQREVWDERVNPRGKSPQKNRGEIQRRESWMKLVKRAKKELTERELCTIPDLHTLQRLVKLYKLDDPVNSARIELYWQGLHGMRVPESGKLCEPVISLHKIAPQPSVTPMTGVSPRCGSIIYTNQQLSPVRSISPPVLQNGHSYIYAPRGGDDYEGRDFHDLPKPITSNSQPVTVSVSHSPSPARAEEGVRERVRPPSVSVDRRSVGTPKASPRSVLYSARSNMSSASPAQRIVSPYSRSVFSSGGGTPSGKAPPLRPTQMSPSKTSVVRTRSAGPTVNTCGGINRRYGNGPTSPNASDVTTIGAGRERDTSHPEGGINRYYSNAPADTTPDISRRKKSPVRVLSQKNVSSPYSIGNDGEVYKQVATIKTTNSSNPYTIGEGSPLQSPGRRRLCGGTDGVAASNPNMLGDEGRLAVGRAMSPLSHANTTGKGSNPNPVVVEDYSPSRKRQTNTTDSHGCGSNPNPYSDGTISHSSKRSFSAPASQRQTWSISGSLQGAGPEACKKSTQSEARIAQAVGSSNSSLTMINAGREGESRRQAAVKKEKDDGDQYFSTIPPPTSRITDESPGPSPMKSLTGIRMSSVKNTSNLSDSNFIPNPINRCQTPPGTRTGKSAHLIFGADECSNKTIKRVCPLPHEKQHPSPNRRRQFLDKTQAAQAHSMEFN